MHTHTHTLSLSHTHTLSLATCQVQLEYMDQLYDLFVMFDLDGDNSISRQELERIFTELVNQKKVPRSYMVQRMKEADKNKDGTVLFGEYVRMQTAQVLPFVDIVKEVGMETE